jgi:hypothetical protein
MNNLSFAFKNGGWAYRLGIFAIISSVVFLSSPAAWIPLAGNLDEWYYIGYGKFYFQNPDFHTYYYKISRLPWILIQAAFRSIFSDQVANTLIVFVYLLIIAYVVFEILKGILGKGVALLISILFSLLPTNQGLGGWNYHNTAAGPFFLICLWFLLKATEIQSRRSLAVFLAGACLTLCVHSNIVFVNLLPVVPVWVLAIYFARESSPRFLFSAKILFKKCLSQSCFFIAGGILITALLSGISIASGRPFDFWKQQFLLASRFVTDNTNQLQWWKPLSSEWVLQSPWLIFPLAILLANLVWIALAVLQAHIGSGARIVDSSFSKVLFSLQAIFTSILWVFWQVMGQTALDWSYFTYPLLFSSLLGILPFFKWIPSVSGLSSKSVFWISLGFIMVIPILVPDLTRQIHLQHYQWLWVVATVVITGLLLLSSLTNGKTAIQASAISFIFIVLTISSKKTSEFSKNDLTNQVKVDLSNSVFQMAEKVGSKIMRKGQKVAIWFDDDEKLVLNQNSSNLERDIPEQLQRLYNPAASLNSLGLSYFPRPPQTKIQEIPIFKNNTDKHLEDGNPIVMVTNNQDNVNLLLERINQAGFSYSVLKEDKITSEFFEIKIYILSGSSSSNPQNKQGGA